MRSDEIGNQSTCNVYSMHKYRTFSVQESLKNIQRVNTDSTNGGEGGDDDMEKRLTILEAKFGHIDRDIGEIKSDIREIRSSIWIAAALIIPSIIGLYIYINSETNDLSKELHSVKLNVNTLASQMEYVRSDVGELKADVKDMKSDMNSMKSSLDRLASDVSKLAKDNK